MFKSLCILIMVLLNTGCASIVYKTKFGLEPGEEKHITERQYYLPKALLSFTGSVDKNKEATVTLASTIVPDSARKLYLVSDHSWFHDDNFVITTTGGGLLTSINTKTTFKGVEIAGKIGELVGAAAKLAALKTAPQERAPDCKEPPPLPFSLSLEIDPYDLISSASETNMTLDKYCFHITVPIKKDEIKIENAVKQWRILDEGENEFPIGTLRDGIAHRETIDVVLMVEFTYPGNYTKKQFRVSIPDRIAFAPVKRGIFVSRQHDYTFSNGVLTSSTLDYPSEAMGLLSTPFALLNGLAQAITGRFDSKNTSLNNKTQALESEIKLLEAEKRLADVKK